MKSTFSRTFSAAATILLMAVLLLGIAFPLLVKDYLQENTISDLENDAQVISRLATAFAIDNSISNREFLRNLDIAADVSDADAVYLLMHSFFPDDYPLKNK